MSRSVRILKILLKTPRIIHHCTRYTQNNNTNEVYEVCTYMLSFFFIVAVAVAEYGAKLIVDASQSVVNVVENGKNSQFYAINNYFSLFMPSWVAFSRIAIVAPWVWVALMRGYITCICIYEI